MAFDLDAALTGISGILVTPYDDGGRHRAGASSRRSSTAPLGAGVAPAGGQRQYRRVLRADHRRGLRHGAGGGRAGRWPRPGARRGRSRHSRRLPARAGLGRRRRHGADDPPAARSRSSRRAARSTTSRRSATPRAACRSCSICATTRSATAGIAALCALAGRQGREMGHAQPAEARRGARRLRSRHRLGRRPRRGLGADLLRRRRPRLHLGPDQRLAGAFDRDPCRPRGVGLCEGARPDRRRCGSSRTSAPRRLNGTNVTAVKAALQALGRDCGPTRPPSAWPLTDDQHAPDGRLHNGQRPDLRRDERTAHARRSDLHPARQAPDRGRTGSPARPPSPRIRRRRLGFGVGTPASWTAPPAPPRTLSGATATPRARRRAKFLEAIADEIEARGAEITEIGTSETGLPAARLEGERGRTTGQLRLFASHVRDGACLDRRHDAALPDRGPLPRPDLRMIERPIGPVAVFGASNFPLAFSTAGGMQITYSISRTISGWSAARVSSIVASVIGNVNRRGPALPGLR